MSEEQQTEVKVRGKPGRPRKDQGVIFYRSGGRVKAWHQAMNAAVNMPREIPDNARLYDGIGEDWAAWKSQITRDGDYNTARRSPFRKAPDRAPAELEVFEKAFDELVCTPFVRVFTAIDDLHEGRQPESPIKLTGTWWMRALANVFVREAGAEGISRSRFERPEGKIWASVNVLPPVGNGYNYSEEAWYAVVNMIRPPVFCVRVEGDRYQDDAGLFGQFSPEAFAACVLYRLRQTQGVDSCAADAGKPSEPPPAEKSEPEAPALASEAPAPCEDMAEPATLPAASETPVSAPETSPSAEAEQPASVEPAPEAQPEEPAAPAKAKTWGEIQETGIWLKGTTTAKDLLAPMPLSRVLEMVTRHEVTRKLTEECRAIGDKKARNEFKRDNLRVWYPSALFAERFKGAVKENVAGYTGLACLDFDGFESPEKAIEAKEDIFVEFKEVLFSAVSASGLGVYALVALDFDGTDDGYRDALEAAFEMFESKGYMPDTGCSDPTRARYLAADDSAWTRPPEWVPVAVSASEGAYNILPASMLRQCWTNSARRRKGAGKEYLKEALERIASAPEGHRDTTITSVMGTIARLVTNYGLDAEEAYNRVRQVAQAYGYDTKKTEDKIRRLGVRSQKIAGGDTDAG